MMMLKFITPLILVALAAPAVAQTDYPTQPINLVLPFPPGGGTDAVARLVTEGLTERFGQRVLVSNRPGAAGNIATDFVARSAPDGYTLLMGFSTALTVTPHISGDQTFDVAEEFIPITELAEGQYILVVNADLPVNSVEELVAYARNSPGELNYGSSGLGSPHHLATELFMNMTQTEMTHLPYTGAAGSVAAVLGNEAQVVFGSVTGTLAHIEAGSMRALATSGLTRLPILPDVPTLDESGLQGFNVATWYGLLAPAGTPQPIIDRLYTETVAVLNEDDLIEGLDRLGLEPIGNTGEEFAERIARETAMWVELIEEAQISLD